MALDHVVDRCMHVYYVKFYGKLCPMHSIQEVAVLIFYNNKSWWSTMFEAPQEMQASIIQTTQAERQHSPLHFHTVHPILLYWLPPPPEEVRYTFQDH